jgi:predicted amidohydrolase YtcJ
VTRRRADGTPDEHGWHSNERLTLDEALNGFTLAPDETAGINHRAGILSSGYYADLIVLEKDPFQIPAQDLHQILPDATMVGGIWVWNKPG